MRIAAFLALIFTLLAGLWDGLTHADELTVNPELSLDASKVVTYRECMKCHAAEIEVWKQTPHFKTYDSLHRRDKAKEIAGKMGIKSIKRNEVCTQCHYTLAENSSGHAKAVSGISCESCHGPAKDWLHEHADYGGPNATREQESVAHKQSRREKSIACGMNNPSNLYLIARNCYNCHTVPNEKLINVGGHPAGSMFELVSWSQGMVRHNFLSTDGKANTKSPVERLRVMFVVGLMADLEYSLRSVAKSTERAEFAFRMAKRVDVARNRLKMINSKLNDPLIGKAIDAAYQAKLKLANQEKLVTAADNIAEVARQFAESVDGSTLGALDGLMPPERVYK